MINNNNTISVTYTDAELRNLVEEYITQQKGEFTLKGVCTYILYWAVEEGKMAERKNLIECYELRAIDQDRVRRVLETIAMDGRIVSASRYSYLKS